MDFLLFKFLCKLAFGKIINKAGLSGIVSTIKLPFAIKKMVKKINVNVFLSAEMKKKLIKEYKVNLITNQFWILRKFKYAKNFLTNSESRKKMLKYFMFKNLAPPQIRHFFFLRKKWLRFLRSKRRYHFCHEEVAEFLRRTGLEASLADLEPHVAAALYNILIGYDKILPFEKTPKDVQVMSNFLKNKMFFDKRGHYAGINLTKRTEREQFDLLEKIYNAYALSKEDKKQKEEIIKKTIWFQVLSPETSNFNRMIHYYNIKTKEYRVPIRGWGGTRTKYYSYHVSLKTIGRAIKSYDYGFFIFHPFVKNGV